MTRSIRSTATDGWLRSSLFWSAMVLILACSSGTEPVPVPEVAQVVVQPSANAMVEGDLSNYSARLLDRNGHALEGLAVVWTSANELVATVSSGGVVTAHAAGTTVIKAASGGKVGSGLLEVTRAPVASVELRPATLDLSEGQVMALTAIARNAAGGELPGRVATWATTDPVIASIATDGVVTANSSGTAWIRVTIESHDAEARVTVRPAAVASVEVTPGASVIETGEQRQMTAVVKDARGNVLRDRPVAWSVDGNAAIISPSGVITGVRNGYVTVRATSEGIAGAVGATVVPGEPSNYELLYYRYSPPGAMELFTLAPGTGQAPARINAGTVSRNPTPSPDGQRIAFAVSMELPFTGERIDDIFAVNRNGMNMVRLTSMAGADDSPSWSPVGGMIAFHHWDAFRSDIWVMAEDGATPTNLTADMPASGMRGAPAWSRDGTRIAFSELENGPGLTTASIWVMNADGSGKQRVTVSTNGFDASPTWAPGGDRLAFVRFYSGEADITIVEINSGVQRRILHAGLEGKPSWSPDGRMIAFSADPRNNLYTIAPDGTGLRLRTVDPAWGGGLAPVWISNR